MRWTDPLIQLPRFSERPSGLLVPVMHSRPVVSPAGGRTGDGLPIPSNAFFVMANPPSTFDQMRVVIDESSLNQRVSTPDELKAMAAHLSFENGMKFFGFGGESVDMANYSGGAHPAEFIAKDGAGNATKRTWTINVDPEGHVSASEAEDTLESLDSTSPVNTVGDPEEDLDVEGTAEGYPGNKIIEGNYHKYTYPANPGDKCPWGNLNKVF